MAKARKDLKGRTLRKGEYQRSSDKMYVYAYRDFSSKRRVVYARDLVELREKEKALIHDSIDGIDSYVAGKCTVNELFDRYIATKTELRSTTRTNYFYMYDKFVRDQFGMRRLGSVKYSDVITYYLGLMKDGLKVNTVDNIHHLISPAFDMAVRDDVIRKNPCFGALKEIKSKAGKSGKSNRYALTADQEDAFLNYINDHEVYGAWYPLFMFLFGTGCRIGEAIGIRWEDIDLKARRIDINHAVTYGPNCDKGYACGYEVHPPKTACGERKIPIVSEVQEVLESEYDRQSKEGFSDLELGGMTGFVFTNRFGSLHNPPCVNEAIKRIYTSYNAEEIVKAAREGRDPVIIPHFSCHQIRHTFATRLCEVESNLKVIQSIMGHADIRTTMDIYAEVTDTGLDSALDKLCNKRSIV